MTTPRQIDEKERKREKTDRHRRPRIMGAGTLRYRQLRCQCYASGGVANRLANSPMPRREVPMSGKCGKNAVGCGRRSRAGGGQVSSAARTNVCPGRGSCSQQRKPELFPTPAGLATASENVTVDDDVIRPLANPSSACFINVFVKKRMRRIEASSD